MENLFLLLAFLVSLWLVQLAVSDRQPTNDGQWFKTMFDNVIVVQSAITVASPKTIPIIWKESGKRLTMLSKQPKPASPAHWMSEDERTWWVRGKPT